MSDGREHPAYPPVVHRHNEPIIVLLTVWRRIENVFSPQPIRLRRSCAPGMQRVHRGSDATSLCQITFISSAVRPIYLRNHWSSGCVTGRTSLQEIGRESMNSRFGSATSAIRSWDVPRTTARNGYTSWTMLCARNWSRMQRIGRSKDSLTFSRGDKLRSFLLNFRAPTARTPSRLLFFSGSTFSGSLMFLFSSLPSNALAKPFLKALPTVGDYGGISRRVEIANSCDWSQP